MDDTTRATIETAIREGAELLTAYAFSAAGAIVILIIGFIMAGILSRWTRAAVLRLDHADKTLAGFLSKAVRYGVLILVFVTVLAQFGVQTTSILAALGAAGLAIGLALQGTLANIAAGIMLLVLRPFRVGEYIDAGGLSGTVKEIGLFSTELERVDGLFIMAPNSTLWPTAIANYSRNPTRRFELIVGIGYDDSMQKAREELLALANEDARVLKAPEPVTFVNSLDDSSVGVGLRVWVNASDYLKFSWDMTELAKARFDDAGITIPYPQREIRQKAE